MKFDYYGKYSTEAKIMPLVKLLEKADSSQLWNYLGLKVEIDPTIDFNNQNVLIRWTDVEEGFNDKMIVYSIEEFNANFISRNDKTIF